MENPMALWNHDKASQADGSAPRPPKVLWDVSQGGAGPRVRNGRFSLASPGTWMRALTILSVSVLAGRFGAPLHQPAPSEASTLFGREMNTTGAMMRLAQDTSTGTVHTPPPSTHHDSHNDKTMSTLGGQHLDQHGDSNAN
jgi:hypothetical protein